MDLPTATVDVDQGFRAEYAQVVAVAIPEHIRIRDPKLARTLRELALGFDASLVTLEELESAGREFGDPVPSDARPKAGPKASEYGRVAVTLGVNTTQLTQAMRQFHAAVGQIGQQQAGSLQSLVRAVEQSRRRRQRARWWSLGLCALAVFNAAVYVFGDREWVNGVGALVAVVGALAIYLPYRY